MQKFAYSNPTLSRMIHRLCWNNEEDYELWIESLVKPTTWGGPAEYTFHVLCISVLLPIVKVHSSSGRKEIMDESKSNFVKKPLCESNVIFIWLHNGGNPKLFLGKDSGIDDPKIYNRFALLKKMPDSEKIDPEGCLILTHVDDDEDLTVISVYMPDKSKEKEVVSKNDVGQDQYSPKNNKE
jgi:hypothetical protein